MTRHLELLTFDLSEQLIDREGQSHRFANPLPVPPVVVPIPESVSASERQKEIYRSLLKNYDPQIPLEANAYACGTPVHNGNLAHFPISFYRI